MAEGTALADALTHEHHEIDRGVEAYVASLADGADPAPLRGAMAALRRHIYLEETFLFPPLKHGGLMMALMVMERQHGELWRLMDGLDTALAAASPDAAALRDECAKFLALLNGHNTKEEPIVYPKADSDLDEPTRTQLADFLASGSFPDGWTCAKAAA